MREIFGFKLEVPDFLKHNPSGIPELKVCMMGPRSVGKTTVLTSIFAETQVSICGSKLYLNAVDANTGKLTGYHTSLMDAVAKRNAANLPASNCESTFKFGLGLKGQQASLHLVVQDFPGEYLTSKPEIVNAYMAESTVVLIAIDTPYMMEEGGRYNMQKNRVDVVTQYLKNNPNEVKDKLVLFVPLKCERYAHDGRIDEVSEKVEKTYAELIEFFNNNNIASVVTPIHTLGGIEFDKMVDSDRHDFETEKIAAYQMYEKEPQYEPMYCCQPMYYIFTYLVDVYRWQNEHPGGLWKKLKQTIFSYFMNDKTFYDEVLKMRQYVLINREGYKLLTTNSIFQIK